MGQALYKALLLHLESDISLEQHLPPTDMSLHWPFFQSGASLVPIPRQIVGLESNLARSQSAVDANGDQSDEEGDDSDGELHDDHQELFSAGRRRQKRLPSLKIGDMVVSLSPDDILWFGRLKETKHELSEDQSDGADVSDKFMLVHWWDHDRNDPDAKKTYRPHWSRPMPQLTKRRSRKKRRLTRECTEKYTFNKPSARSGWQPNQDWVPATSLIYWAPFGKMVNRKGELYERFLKQLQVRVSLYGKEFRL